jgi:hypothetical protein
VSSYEFVGNGASDNDRRNVYTVNQFKLEGNSVSLPAQRSVIVHIDYTANI